MSFDLPALRPAGIGSASLLLANAAALPAGGTGTGAGMALGDFVAGLRLETLRGGAKAGAAFIARQMQALPGLMSTKEGRIALAVATTSFVAGYAAGSLWVRIQATVDALTAVAARKLPPAAMAREVGKVLSASIGPAPRVSATPDAGAATAARQRAAQPLKLSIEETQGRLAAAYALKAGMGTRADDALDGEIKALQAKLQTLVGKLPAPTSTNATPSDSGQRLAQPLQTARVKQPQPAARPTGDASSKQQAANQARRLQQLVAQQQAEFTTRLQSQLKASQVANVATLKSWIQTETPEKLGRRVADMQAVLKGPSMGNVYAHQTFADGKTPAAARNRGFEQYSYGGALLTGKDLETLIKELKTYLTQLSKAMPPARATQPNAWVVAPTIGPGGLIDPERGRQLSSNNVKPQRPVPGEEQKPQVLTFPRATANAPVDKKPAGFPGATGDDPTGLQRGQPGSNARDRGLPKDSSNAGMTPADIARRNGSVMRSENPGDGVGASEGGQAGEVGNAGDDAVWNQVWHDFQENHADAARAIDALAQHRHVRPQDLMREMEATHLTAWQLVAQSQAPLPAAPPMASVPPAPFPNSETAYRFNFPVSASIATDAGVDMATFIDLQLKHRLTAAEALIELGVDPATALRDDPSDPAARDRFVTHPTVYGTNNRYDQFAAATESFAGQLLRNSSIDRARDFVAEGKKQFEMLVKPSRRISEFGRIHPAGSINPTYLVAEGRDLGDVPAYRDAAQAALALMARHPDQVAAYLNFADLHAHDGQPVRRLIEDMANNGGLDVLESTLSQPLPQVLDQLRAHLGGPYNTPLLEGHLLRMPLRAADGQEAATLYVFEREQVAGSRVSGSGRYSLEVMVDQGAFANREAVTTAVGRTLSQFAKQAPGAPSVEAATQFADAAYALYLTSGAYTGGGAGHTHIMVAAAWQARTGTHLPKLTMPLDLFALTHTRDEFVEAFLKGTVFRGDNPMAPLDAADDRARGGR